MNWGRTFTSALLAAALAGPAVPADAQDRAGRRQQGGGDRAAAGAPAPRQGGGARAVPRGAPQSRQAGPQARQAGPQVRQGGPQVRQGGPQVRQGGPQVRQGGPQPRPGTQVRPGAPRGSAGPRYSGQAAPRNDNGRYYTGQRAVPRPPSRYYGPGYGSPRGYSRPYYAAPYYGRPYYYARPYPRPYSYAPYRPYYFSRPYYTFAPRLSIGFGLWVGSPVPYPYAYLGSYTPRVYGYAPQPAYEVTPDVPIHGGVSFDLQPSDADVFVDGEYVGRADNFTPNTEPLTLTPGVHRIAVQRDGFRSMEWEVTIEPGQVIPYRGTMARY